MSTTSSSSTVGAHVLGDRLSSRGGGPPNTWNQLVARETTSCTNSTAVQRKEYGSLTADEKLAYVNGIQCLMAKPSQYAAGVVPAATSRYLDFTATHVNHTYSVHFSGIFLSWHRHFVYLLEQALHEDCGFPADLGVPYWDWALYPNLTDSPLWDGTATSLGSNGSATTTTDDNDNSNNCVVSGPFSNATVTFGPFTLNTTLGATLPTNWTAANPRCLSRTLTNAVIDANNNQTDVDSLVAADNITMVLRTLNSLDEGDGFTAYGLHGGGHYAIGGTERDFFASTQDPIFFLHHAMIDRLWSAWQDAHPELRYTYNGTSTLLDPPGVTPEVDNATVLDFGILDNRTLTLGDVGDPMSGPYCYIYV